MRHKIGQIFSIMLVAGTLDITENIVFNFFRGINPSRIFQYIASGLVGLQAFKLGWTSVVLGLLMHYVIALAWTALFYFAAERIPFLIRRPIVSGLIYGALVYLVMTFVVVPHSGVPPPRSAPTLVARVNAVLALLFCIGLTVSLLTRRSLRPSEAVQPP